MITEIIGCLIKYGEPWPDGSIVTKGACDKHNKNGDLIPVYEGPPMYCINNSTKDPHIGFIELSLCDDGVYYIFHPKKDDYTQSVLQSHINLCNFQDDSLKFYIAPWCDNIRRNFEDGDKLLVNSCRIRYSFINHGKWSSSYIEKVCEVADEAKLTSDNTIRLATNLSVMSSSFFRSRKSSNVVEFDDGKRVAIFMPSKSREFIRQTMDDASSLLLQYHHEIDEKNGFDHGCHAKGCPNPDCNARYSFFYKDWKFCPKCGTELIGGN